MPPSGRGAPLSLRDRNGKAIEERNLKKERGKAMSHGKFDRPEGAAPDA